MEEIEEIDTLQTFGENEEQIIEIDRTEYKDEHMLPVHFLPEGKKCYDWINNDIESNKHISKPKTKYVNSVTYTSAGMNNPSHEQNKMLLSATERKDCTNLVQSFLSAAENNDLEFIENILEKQPTLINSKDSDGYTAIHRACYSGHYNIVLYLIKHGANIFAQTNDGWQPIHCAARWNQLDVCKLLIEHRVDVNATTNGGQTPLHLVATTIESQQLLELLLLQPLINANIKNTAGDTPYDLAYRNGPHYKLFDLVDPGLQI